MRHWVGIVTAEQFATERLYARDVVAVPTGPDEAAAEQGDPVALVVAARPSGHPPSRPVLVGHGVVTALADATEAAPGHVLVAYRGRLFDEPSALPADLVPATATAGLFPLPPSQFTRLAALVSAAAEVGAERPVWFVSVALPIEAATRAEAVREFWTYLDKLGPQELPAYVWPLGDELAMQAFVLGAVTNLDPEEDGED